MSVSHYAALFSVLKQQSNTINEESSEGFPFFVPFVSVDPTASRYHNLAIS